MSRWEITQVKRKIRSTDFENHSDDLELTGEKVSGLIKYSVKEGILKIGKLLFYPEYRLQPDNTHASFKISDESPSVELPDSEKFISVEIDGTLTFETVSGNLEITRKFYPSTELPIFYEDVIIKNKGKTSEKIKVNSGRLKTTLTCQGYVYTERLCDNAPLCVECGETVKVTFSYVTYYADAAIPEEEDALRKRYDRVDELLRLCDLTTGNDVIDTMFAFSKIHVAENLFRTQNGLINSPGGFNFYWAIWCNDQCEYATPWFALSGDKKSMEAAKTALRWYKPFMTDELLPLPSSIISGGTDYWNGVGDRGDAEMYLFGNSKYFLETGETPSEEELFCLDWCARYTVKMINENDFVVSDTDELENRLPSGINLSTSCIAYGALKYYSSLLKRLNKDKESERYLKYARVIEKGIEEYFGANIHGYDTYAYYRGCDVIRSWDCLPAYMKIFNRKDDSLKAVSDLLWMGGSCLSVEKENIVWDRSAIFFMTALFRAGKEEEAFSKLVDFSETRLLGERVPYAVEAYPENDMRQISAESALYCRIITDGLLDIDYDEKGFSITPHLPEEIKSVSLKNVYLNGSLKNITVNEGNVTVEETID